MNRFRNFVALSSAEAVSKLATFAAFAYLARVLGASAFGLVEFAAALMLCAGLVVDQGFGPYGAREIARAPQRTDTLVAEIVFARFLLSIVAYAGVVIVALTLDRPAMATSLILTYSLSLFVMPLLLQWVFQGHERMHLVAVSQIVRQVTFAAVVFAFVRNPADIWVAAIAELTATIAAAGYCVAMYRQRLGGTLRMGSMPSTRLFLEGVPIGLSQLFWMVRMFGATLLLGVIALPEDVAYFASGQRILIALHAFVWLYYFNLLPGLTRAWQQQGPAFAMLMQRSLRTVAWVSAAAGIAWVLLAPPLTTTIYGSAFTPAIPTVQWLAGVCVVAALSGHYRFGLIAAGRQTVEMVTSGAGALVAIGLVPVLYRSEGPAGAAMALLITEIAVWLASWLCARRLLAVTHHAPLLLRPSLATAAAFTSAWALAASAQGLRMVAALGVFATAALLLEGGAWGLRKRQRLFA